VKDPLVAHPVDIRQVIDTTEPNAPPAIEAMAIGIKLKPGLPHNRDILPFIRTIYIRPVPDRPMARPHIWIPYVISRAPNFRTAWNYLIPIQKCYWHLAETALPYDSVFDPYATIVHQQTKVTHTVREWATFITDQKNQRIFAGIDRSITTPWLPRGIVKMHTEACMPAGGNHNPTAFDGMIAKAAGFSFNGTIPALPAATTRSNTIDDYTADDTNYSQLIMQQLQAAINFNSTYLPNLIPATSTNTSPNKRPRSNSGHNSNSNQGNDNE
jgi:hypothetical protein